MAETRSRLDLEEDIAFYQSMINSLEGVKNVEDEIETYRNCLADLNTELENMDNTQAARSSERDSPASEILQTFDGSGSSTMNSTQKKSPSRKRSRSILGEDYLRVPFPKSFKVTPDDSPTISDDDSFISDFFNDPQNEQIFGSNWHDGQREAWKTQEMKRLQEEEDARFARELEQRWKEEAEMLRGHTTSTQSSKRPSITPNTSFSQSSFKANGSFEKPVVEKVKTEKPPSLPYRPSNASTTLNLDSDNESLEEISASQWTPRVTNQPQNHQHLNKHPPPGMHHPPTSYQLPSNNPFHPQPVPPGLIMQSPSPYASLGGSSVYGGIPSYNGPSSFLGAFNGLAKGLGMESMNAPGGTIDSIRSLFGKGTSSDPFDLNGKASRPLPPSWQTETWTDPAETQEEIRQLLKQMRPDEELSASDVNHVQPIGLKEKLMPHQIKGVAWMKKMEEAATKGGILADDMGLGKTMQAIALMLDSPRPNGARKPNLVVAPVALIEQWKREITKMVKKSHSLTVATLYGQSARVRFSEICHYDVVMTTYGTLTSELKRHLHWVEILKRNANAVRSRTQECPMLGEDSHFHRIILDEAQWIKNKGTKAAHAACTLRGDYRWCLSGTPMQNNVEEIYSLIKFLRVRPYCDQQRFSREISRPLKAKYGDKEPALKKLQVLLKSILLRRTKQSKIDGKPIIQLPPKTVVEDRAHFSADELSFYQALESKAQITFNRYLRAGTVGRNYSHALVLLLRLRQACCSPQLVTNAKDFLAETGLDGNMDMVANAKELPHNVVVRILEQFDAECPICMDAVENPIIFSPCGHGLCQECLSKMVDTAMQESGDSVKCPHCRAKIDTKKVTDYESFKQTWGPDAELKATSNDNEEESGSETVDTDDSGDETEDNSDEGEDLRDFVVDDSDDEFATGKPGKRAERSKDYDPDVEDFFAGIDSDSEIEKQPLTKRSSRRSLKGKEVAREEDNSSRKLRREKKSKKGKYKKSKKSKKRKDGPVTLADLRKEGLRNKASKRHYIKKLAEDYHPSAKIEKTLSLLQEIHDRNEDEKVIIFSSFTSFLDLLEVPLSQQNDLTYARYDGSMKASERNESVLRFTDDPHCRIILVSIKAGNAGLNLTAANHVIILDPFWNPYVEYQAADRCYRIGQRREVTVHRVLIGEEGVDHAAEPDRQFTVEDRILQLQEKKKKLVEAALDENATSAVGRLGVRELGYLFGLNDISGRALTNGEQGGP